MNDIKIDEENIEEIADSFEITMKKGFLSGLILLVLQNDPCHGYKIIKEIDTHTLGFFKPTSSTLYPLLDSLNKKKLIKIVEKNETGRHKKVYKITSKGEKTLKMILQKHNKMIDSIKTMIFSTIGITDENEPMFLEFLDTIISTPAMNLISEKSKEGKIETLKYYRKYLQQESKIIKSKIEDIDDLLNNFGAGVEKNEIKTNNVITHQS